MVRESTYQNEYNFKMDLNTIHFYYTRHKISNYWILREFGGFQSETGISAGVGDSQRSVSLTFG